jgi:peptidoglycan-associated lipoprotein
VAAAACAPRPPKVTNTPTQPAPPAVAEAPVQPVQPSAPPATQPVTRAEAVRVDESPIRQPVDTVTSASIEELNKNSLLKPAFFSLDSYELDDSGRATVTADADILKKYPTWKITVEGHADERGTAEYNLALGERRATAVKSYLLTLGIGEDRLQTVSYGKEFPFDPGHDESAWSKNRRAHFVITAK